jgi:hypothetical protein
MAPVPIALPFDWEGFYVGAHTGAVTNDLSFTQTNVTWSGSGFRPDPEYQREHQRVRNGLQAGYYWVLPGPYLFGIEADISGTDISSTVLTNPPGDPSAVAQWNDKVNAYGSARARLGWEYDTSSIVSSRRSPDSPNSQDAAPGASTNPRSPASAHGMRRSWPRQCRSPRLKVMNPGHMMFSPGQV